MQSSKPFLTSIFLTALIDMLGIGIIIPVLPAIFYSKDALHLGLEGENQIRWAYCLLMASYSFMLFFGAPVLGTLSDRFGRRPIILTSIIGTALGYLCFIFALKQENIILLFISRMIPGFFAGNLSVLFSSISDISPLEDRPKNFALIGIAFGLGFVIGPFVGGLLSDNSLSIFFNIYTPFIFTAFLCIINFILVYFRFQETNQNLNKRPINVFQGAINLKRAYSILNLRVLFFISFLVTLGFAFFTQFFSVFMFEKFHLSAREVGYIFGWVGLWIVITQGFILRKIGPYTTSEQIVSITMLVMGVGIASMIFPGSIYGILICNLIVAISQGLNSPNFLTIISKQATSENQGEIMGINQSMQAIGNVIPPLIVGFFGENLKTFPLMMAGGLICFGWIIFMTLYYTKRK